MNALKIVLPAGLMLFSGCAGPTEYFAPVVQPGQKLVHVTANPVIKGVQQISDDAWVEVLFEPTVGNTLFNGMAVFWVYVRNTGNASFDFGAQSVSIEDKNGRPIQLLTLDKVAQKLRGNKTRQEFAFIIASSFLSALEAAPYSQVTQTGVYSGYTPTGQHVSGVTYTTGPNTTVQYMAQQQNSEKIDAFSGDMNAAYARALANIERLSLKPVTLSPGSAIEGIVAVPLPNTLTLPNRFRFTVLAGTHSSVHAFTISRSAQ